MNPIWFKREGVATTECALALPVIIAFTLFTIEVCSIIFLEETVTIAAYEGARVGIQRNGDDAIVEFRVREFLDQRGIVYDNPVFVEDPGFDNADEMEHVRTVVTVPAAGNLPFGWFFNGTDIAASVTMRKEFRNAN